MQTLMQFYEEEYGGSAIPPGERGRILRRASGMVDGLTCRSELLRAEHEQALAFACCAVGDVLWEGESRGTIQRETNGDVTIAYRTGGLPSLYEQVYTAALPYLGGTGLLYRGVAR